MHPLTSLPHGGPDEPVKCACLALGGSHNVSCCLCVLVGLGTLLLVWRCQGIQVLAVSAQHFQGEARAGLLVCLKFKED